MFYHLFTASLPINPMVKDQVQDRIIAKKNLYDHFDQILIVIRQADLSIEELTEELIRDCIEQLHPTFTGSEIYQELEFCFTVFLLTKPDTLYSTFITQYLKFLRFKLDYNG